MPAYCEVALPLPLDRTFTYALRDGQRPQRGTRVIVPFNSEKLIGIVTSVSEMAPPEFKVRSIEAMLDEDGGPLLGEPLLKLGEWMAQYYLAPLGEVLRGMLPLMAEVRRIVYYRITDLGRDALAKAMDGDTTGTKGPRDLGTKGPRDQGPRDQGTKGTRDQGTKGRRDREKKGKTWRTASWSGWPAATP